MRELEHVISRAALKQLSRGGSRSLIITLEPEVLDLDTSVPAAANTELPEQGHVSGMPPPSLSEAVDACQRRTIIQALELSENNWASAARLLQVDPSSLHKLAKRLRLK
ncbi:Nitric oxide reductase transcription regulator NorR2 [compost metagenome]